MTDVKMKAVDQLHISALGPDSIPPEGEFEVSAAEADRLEKAGLATRVGGAKAEPSAPENKMEPAPANKGIISAFDHDKDGHDGGAPKGGNRKRKGK